MVSDRSREHGPGFLLSAADAVTQLWVNHLSIAALPPFRRKTSGDGAAQQVARDIFVLGWLGFALLAVVLATGLRPSSTTVHVLAAVALYRALDLFTMLLRAGIFLSFRGDIQLNAEPTWRIRRILLAIFINYVEVLLWYGIVYFYLSTAPSAFAGAAPTHVAGALQMGMATLTMVGYGSYAPDAFWLTLITFSEIAIGLILVVLVVGALLALLVSSSDSVPALNASPASHRTTQRAL